MSTFYLAIAGLKYTVTSNMWLLSVNEQTPKIMKDNKA